MDSRTQRKWRPSRKSAFLTLTRKTYNLFSFSDLNAYHTSECRQTYFVIVRQQIEPAPQNTRQVDVEKAAETAFQQAIKGTFARSIQRLESENERLKKLVSQQSSQMREIQEMVQTIFSNLETKPPMLSERTREPSNFQEF